MAPIRAGELDRRIDIELDTGGRDASGDHKPNWTFAFKRWARRQDLRVRETVAAQEVLRECDTRFKLRDDSQSRTIAPETHRIVHKGRVFEIVGISEGEERGDALIFLCAYRPDLRGASGPVDVSDA